MTYDELYQYAIFMLSRRDYGTTELKRRLKHTKDQQKSIKLKHSTTDERCLELKVIERLLEGQYLDDNARYMLFSSLFK